MTKNNYSLKLHFPDEYEDVSKLYSHLSSAIQSLDNRIKEDPKKLYIGFKIERRVLVAVRVQKTKLCLELYRVEPDDLDDPKHKVRYKTGSFEDFNKHVSILDVRSDEDIKYAVKLVEQVLGKFF